MDAIGSNLPEHMQYLTNMPDQIIKAMTLSTENIPNIIAWLLCMTFGYLMYTEAVKLIRKEKTDPYPLLLHCWMITIDIIGSFTSWLLAIQYDFFWIFVVFGIGLPIWVAMEAYCIYFGIKNKAERERHFPRLTKEPIGIKQATVYALGMIVVSFVFNLYAMDMIGGPANAAVWIIWPITNYVFPIWCWRFFKNRGIEEGTRDGNGMRLQIILTIQITLMWVPGLSWYLAFTQFTHYPFYYICGAVMTALCVINLVNTYKLPAKRPREDGKKVVW